MFLSSRAVPFLTFEKFITKQRYLAFTTRSTVLANVSWGQFFSYYRKYR
jgi:hypothetical protein